MLPGDDGRLIPPQLRALMDAGKVKTFGPNSHLQVLPGPAAGVRPLGTNAAARRRAKASVEVNGVICYDYSDSPGNGNNTITARGHADCTDIVDLLSGQNCWYIWATGGYWSLLNCGDIATASGWYTVTSPPYVRLCTTGRYYLSSNRVSAFDNGGADSGEAFNANWNQCHA